MVFSKKIGYLNQFFHKKSRKVNTIEQFLETRKRILRLFLCSYLVSKKLFKIKITLLYGWKYCAHCTILPSPYYCIFYFEQFFWNRCFVCCYFCETIWGFNNFFLGKSWNYLLKIDCFMGKIWPKISKWMVSKKLFKIKNTIVRWW